jgi:hypothetical protein
MRKLAAILVLTLAAAIPGVGLADNSTKDCPGGPPGHCRTGGNHSQQQQQQQQQSQSQCILVLGLLQPAEC